VNQQFAIAIETATDRDTAAVVEMLREAAEWVDALGVVMWDDAERDSEAIALDVAAGRFAIARIDGNPAGAVRFQTEDLLFWPDIPQDASAFVHRLVVARRYKGVGVSTALLRWAAERARALGKASLRLDCDASRSKLRGLYEQFGFRFHSFRQVGPHYVSRYEYPLG
jgi:GNAT superfamily N-acetyltransferase